MGNVSSQNNDNIDKNLLINKLITEVYINSNHYIYKNQDFLKLKIENTFNLLSESELNEKIKHIETKHIDFKKKKKNIKKIIVNYYFLKINSILFIKYIIDTLIESKISCFKDGKEINLDMYVEIINLFYKYLYQLIDEEVIDDKNVKKIEIKEKNITIKKLRILNKKIINLVNNIQKQI